MNRGQFIAELRRSNAAGPHRNQVSKSQARRLAIMEEEDMYETDLCNEDKFRFIAGPNDDEIWQLETSLSGVDLNELWNDEFDLYDDEEDYPYTDNE